MNSIPIIKTKLYKPAIKDHYVFRKEIIEELEKNRHKHVTLVVAAAGYGKSVTISEWLDHTNSKHCWISLDAELNDLRLFLAHVVYGIKSTYPDSFPELSKILEAQELPSEKTLSNFLINELDEIEEDKILVFDDYHSIDNQQIHDLLNELLKYFPPKLHLVIITRRDPPLKLSTLKSYGDINEIRMADLSFTLTETVSLANKINNFKLNNKLVEKLLKKTEGWIVGLRLALLTMSANKDLEKTMEELGDDKHFFTQFLLDEVFLHQDKENQDVLLIASIFNRFNKDLLKLVMKYHVSKNESTFNSLFDNLFNRFKNSTLFIISLDQEGKWFRYHHFFQEFLSKQLNKRMSDEKIKKYHNTGSEYFYSHNLFEEALHHSVICNNNELIVKIFKENKYDLLDHDHFNILWKWLSIVPEEIIQNEPNLVLTRALLNDTKADYTSMQNDLAIARKLLESNALNSEQKDKLLGEYHAAHSCLSYISGDIEGAIDHCENALKLISHREFYYYDIALAYGAIGTSSLCRPDEAITMVKKKLKELPESYTNSKMRKSLILILLYAFHGNLPEIKKLASQCQAFFYKNKFWVSFSYANYYLSEVNYQWNKLDKVTSYVDKVEEHQYAGRPHWILNCLYTKAFTFQAQGNYEELNLTLLKLNSFARDYEMEQFLMVVKACEVELALRQNNTEKALNISEGVNFEIYPPIFYFYFPQLTYIKLQFHTDEPDRIKEAENRLEKLIEFGRTTFKQNLLIQALPLQSLIFISKGDKEKATNVLKEALTIAEPGGFIRTFLDLGRPMEKLLKIVYETNSDNNYIKKLLNEFEKENVRIEKNQSVNFPVYIDPGTGITEKFSRREIEVLKLVAMGLQNKEIADKLNLSVDSIKKYLYYIYQKLGVRNRIAAIAKANEMGFIQTSLSVN